MNSTNRLMTPRETLLQLVRVGYIFFAFPFLVFIGVITFCMWMSSTPGRMLNGVPLFTSLVWAAIVISVVVYIHGLKTKHHLLKDISSRLREPGLFNPGEANEFYLTGGGKYLGIDAENGTILYINKIRRGQVDVVGMTMGDWTSRELEGKTLRLYTKFPELPCIEINTPWAQRWYDMLGAMEYKRYNTLEHFSKFVSEHVETLERENKIHIPKLA